MRPQGWGPAHPGDVKDRPSRGQRPPCRQAESIGGSQQSPNSRIGGWRGGSGLRLPSFSRRERVVLKLRFPYPETVSEPTEAIPLYRRLAVRVTGTSVLMVALTILYFAVQLQIRTDEDLEVHFGQLLESIVVTAAPAIDGDIHRTIRTRPDASSEAFKTIQAQLREVQEGNGLRVDLLYTFNIQGHLPVAAVMLQEVPYTGDVYNPPPATRPLLDKVHSELASGHSLLYKDVHGEWISGYAPILDSEGRFAGILAADYDISTVRERSRKELRVLVALAFSAMLVAVILSLPMARRLDRSLKQIRIAAEAMEREEYHHRIPFVGRGELGLIANKFNRMAEVLSERFYLLKYLPTHTRNAIENQVIRGEPLHSQRIEATILFSDIRGFTALSNQLTDEDLVSLLVTCLHQQATVIKAAEGTIDKFIGDAVLAVFEGEDSEQKAVRAALDIQEVTARLNAEGLFPLPVGIGIGIASGSLMLADIGSEDRRERTIIGTVVNLASHLCAVAQKNEVVVSESVVQALQGRVHVGSTRTVELKGYGNEQDLHVVVSLDD